MRSANDIFSSLISDIEVNFSNQRAREEIQESAIEGTAETLIEEENYTYDEAESAIEAEIVHPFNISFDIFRRGMEKVKKWYDENFNDPFKRLY